MPNLRYPKRMRYVDSDREREYIGPGNFNVPADAVDEYVDDGWERIEGTSTSDDSDGDDDEVDLCGVPLTSGDGVCERPVDECPYESHAAQRDAAGDE